MNYGFVIDNRKCIGCHACTVACKSEHDVPIGVNRTWVKYIEKGEFPHTRRLFSVMRCNHCESAPCVDICPVEALHYRSDGIVDFDNRRCIGCKACMQACPYDALYIDPESHTAAKCNYCAHRIDIGLEPACVNVCPEHAIISGDMENPASEIAQLLSREQVTARKTEKGTRPNVFYIEGDAAALTPAETNQSTDYMWNSQSTGVGHFAHFAESLIAKSDPLEMVKQLAGNSSHGNSPHISASDAHQEAGRGANLYQKALSSIKKNTRRVYDAPAKGILWGWEVSAYVWTKAISAGAFLLPAAATTFGIAEAPDSVQWFGWIIAMVFLAITGALLVKDLDKPSRFAYVLLRPQWKSWLTRGGYAIFFYGLFLAAWGHGKFWGMAQLETISFFGASIFAILTAVYTAFLFAQSKGRDFWQSPALSLHMLGHSLAAGAAIFALFPVSELSWSPYVKGVIYASLIFNLIIMISEILTPHPTSDAKKTVNMIISGKFRNAFWFGAIGLGHLLPLALLFFGGESLMVLTGVTMLFGIYITEHIWVRAPQLIPLS